VELRPACDSRSAFHAHSVGSNREILLLRGGKNSTVQKAAHRGAYPTYQARLEPEPTIRTTTRKSTRGGARARAPSTIEEGNSPLFKFFNRARYRARARSLKGDRRKKAERQARAQLGRGIPLSSNSLIVLVIVLVLDVLKGGRRKRGRKTRTSARSVAQSSRQARSRSASARCR